MPSRLLFLTILTTIPQGNLRLHRFNCSICKRTLAAALPLPPVPDRAAGNPLDFPEPAR